MTILFHADPANLYRLYGRYSVRCRLHGHHGLRSLLSSLLPPVRMLRREDRPDTRPEERSVEDGLHWPVTFDNCHFTNVRDDDIKVNYYYHRRNDYNNSILF